jgi:hypothetical protein
MPMPIGPLNPYQVNELLKFPRDEETVPEWLGRRLAESTTP